MHLEAKLDGSFNLATIVFKRIIFENYKIGPFKFLK